MNYTELDQYKHDVTGKFDLIKSMVDSMTEENYKSPDNREVFLAIHDVLLQMTKRSTMLLENTTPSDF